MLKLNFKKLPAGIWALGFVSMFMDISSELVHSLLPVFMVSVLGTSVTAVGFVEGVAEAIALIVKVFSGYLSDLLKKRKLLALIGYSLAAFTKPLFPLANSLAAVMTARFTDRIGKGIRGAPRDALIADITPASDRGAAFGLRQSLDTIGAIAGPLLAIFFMWLFLEDIRMVMWIAVIPAFISVTILAFGVKEPEIKKLEGKAEVPIRFSDVLRIGPAYWQVVIIAAILTLARFSEAFLILKTQNIGVTMALIPIVMVIMNIAYTLSAYPAGLISDTFGRRNMLLIGILFLIAADFTLALADNIWLVGGGVILWGLHMGSSQGVLAAMIADKAPSHLRGTAFGVFNLVLGFTLLAASILAGVLWDSYGPSATFYAGAIFAAIAFASLILARKKI